MEGLQNSVISLEGLIELRENLKLLIGFLKEKGGHPLL